MASKAHLFLALLLGTAAVSLTSAALDCKGGTEMTSNPIGSCVCDGQLWVAPGCQQGYYCEDTTGLGCYLECPEGSQVSPDFSQSTWECFTNTGGKGEEEETDVDAAAFRICPFNGYNICPSEATAEPPVDVTANPLGTCRCNGEIWVAEGCTYGFKCDSVMENGGEYLSCDPGEILTVTETESDLTWSCIEDNGSCPGGAIEGIGCEMPDCEYSVSPFGECECDGQMLINDDCSMGFYCQSNIPDPYLYDGCIKRCLPGEVLVPDFKNNAWECLDGAMPSVRCPGKFSLRCPENDIGHGFDGSECECNGQLYVSADCQESFHCIEWLEGGGRHQECNEGEIVDYDPSQTNWRCTTDVENCPGQGGFMIGCQGGGVVVPELQCTFDKNPFGECGSCEGQIFVSDDCTESFYCSTYIPDGEDADGCHLTCEANERVHIDYATNVWECVERESDFVCPGRFQVDCDPVSDIECHCKNELWMEQDCKSAFICNDKEGTNGISQGSRVSCPDPDKPYLKVDFTLLPDYECVSDPAVCPEGTFHFGCEGGDFNPATEEPPVTTEASESTAAPMTTEASESTAAPMTTEASETTAAPLTTDASQTTTTTGGAESTLVASTVFVFAALARLICH